MTGPVQVMLAAGGAKVSVSGESITAVDTGGGTASASVRFNSDGTVDAVQNGTPSQIDAGTDWVRPVHFAPGPYQVRFTLQSGDSPNIGDSLNTWLDLTSNRSTGYSQSGVGDLSGTILAEIGSGDGSAIYNSGEYDLSANVTDSG